MDGFEDRLETVDKQLSDVHSKLDRLLKKVATSDDIARIDDKIDSFKTAQDIVNYDLASQTEALNRWVQSLESGGGSSSSRERELLNAMETSTFRDEYMEARRSLIVSPCTASKEAVKAFLKSKMEIDNEILNDVLVQKIKRMHRKGKKRTK